MTPNQVPLISADRLNLYDLAPDSLLKVLSERVGPPFRIQQIEKWTHRAGVDSFHRMSNLPKDLRQDLDDRFTVSFPAIQSVTDPAADGSRKYLLQLADGGLIESVFMPMDERITVCISSQSGCAVGCTFCVTGFFGGGRNLTPSEMVGQYYTIRNDQGVPSERMNVVFMGMGEPLLNFDHLHTALQILSRDLSLKRITVSTSGIIPGIEALGALPQRPNLAVSINAPDQERREEIMPIARKYPLRELIAALKAFPLERGRTITAEYVLIHGYNDSVDDAGALARLLRGFPVKVNVIPLNEDPNLPTWMKRPSDSTIDRFVRTLVSRGSEVTVRRSKGREIAAACGQLRGKTERRGKAPLS